MSMRCRLIIGALSTLLAARCVTLASDYCLVNHSTMDALALVQQQSWDSLDPERVGEIWPVSLSWSSRADASTPCAGTDTVSHLGSVADNQCRCCDVLMFSDIQIGGTCSHRLSSVTLVRTVPNHDDARRLGAQLLSIVSDHGQDQTLTNDLATRIKEIAPQQQQSSSVAIKQVGDTWEVRLMIYRVSFDL
jgi:hypothetical protein